MSRHRFGALEGGDGGSVCTPDPEENPFPPVRSRAGRRGEWQVSLSFSLSMGGFYAPGAALGPYPPRALAHGRSSTWFPPVTGTVDAVRSTHAGTERRSYFQFSLNALNELTGPYSNSSFRNHDIARTLKI